MVWRSITKKTLLLPVFLVIFLFIPLAQAHTITVPSNVYFGFGNGCYINFNTEKTFDNVYRENNYWYFDGYGFQVQNANTTITDYFSNPDHLSLTVSAPSNTTSTTKIYVGSKGKPYTVKFNGVNYTEGDKWSYNSADSTLTLTWLHSSDVNIDIDWQSSPPPPPPPPPSGGSSGGVSYQLIVTVKDKGVPIDGANISINNLYFGTTVGGKMSFSLPAGTYSITVKYRETTMNKTIELTGDTEVVFDVSEGVTVVPKVDLKGILQKYAGLIFAVILIAVAYYYSRKPSGRVRRGRR